MVGGTLKILHQYLNAIKWVLGLCLGTAVGIVDRELWARIREHKFRRMLEDLDVGYLDPDIYHVLQALFRRSDSFPVSSCSGRITVVDSKLPWHRKGSTVLFKKHSPITEGELLPIVANNTPIARLWLVVTGPIFHISSVNLKEALTLLRIARAAGMKHSGVLSISRRGIYVELKTGVRLTVLLRSGDSVVKDLREVVKAANEALLEGKSRLERLYRLLIESERLGTEAI